MMIHKIGRKLNRSSYLKAASRFWRATGVACIAVGLSGTGSFLLPVQAAPSTLKSPDATIYEQTNEESNAVGSLVEGSSFEYIGDVTAEDGSVWHQVTTANGTVGYIRGDRELELREEEPVPESQEGQEAPVENGGDVPAESESAQDEGAGENGRQEAEAPDGNVPDNAPDVIVPEENENAPDGTEEGGEEEETSRNNDVISDAQNLRNDQMKKYVVGTTAKVKERESTAEINTGIETLKSKKAGIDMALMIGMAVVFFCIGMIILCLSRVRRLKWGTSAEEVLEPGRSRVQRKIEKKKHSPKRKPKKYKRLQGRQKETGSRDG